MAYRFIPRKVHGALDYIVALALIFAPLIFGFQEVGGAAVVVPILMGIALFLYSLLTDYEWGVIRVIETSNHFAVDAVAGTFLLISPFLFNFSGEEMNAWLPHVLVGLAILVVAFLSQPYSRRPEIKSM